MLDPYLYKDWLAEFQREVDDEVERMRRAPAPAPPQPRPAAPEAASGMRAWWDKEVEPPPLPEESMSTVQTNRELDMSRQEVRALRAELEKLRAAEGTTAMSARERIDALASDKTRLEEQLSHAAREAGSLKLLKELKAGVDEQLTALRNRLSAVRGEYEARTREQGERIAALEKENEALAAELDAERHARREAEKTIEEHRRRLAEAEAVRGELAALRASFDTRLETAAEFLEAKIRSVQDQARGRQR